MKIILILLTFISLNTYAGRFYSAEYGRWLNRDPIGVNGGINLYNSVSNNMVNGYVGGLSYSGGMSLHPGKLVLNSGLDPFGFATTMTATLSPGQWNSWKEYTHVYYNVLKQKKSVTGKFAGTLTFNTKIVFDVDNYALISRYQNAINKYWNNNGKGILVAIGNKGDKCRSFFRLKFDVTVQGYGDSLPNGLFNFNFSNTWSKGFDYVAFRDTIDSETSAAVDPLKPSALNKPMSVNASMSMDTYEELTLTKYNNPYMIAERPKSAGVSDASNDHLMLLGLQRATSRIMAHEHGHLLGIRDYYFNQEPAPFLFIERYREGTLMGDFFEGVVSKSDIQDFIRINSKSLKFPVEHGGLKFEWDSNISIFKSWEEAVRLTD